MSTTRSLILLGLGCSLLVAGMAAPTPAGTVLRSELPDLVYQEIWAWFIVQYAMAALITRAAEAADLDPDRLSYTRALHVVRRTATGTAGFSP